MTTHNVALTFLDGIEHILEVEHGGFLLQAALDKGIPLRHQCKIGSCSSCVCKVSQGDLRMEALTSSAIMPAEVADGHRLSCLTKVYSDARVQLPYGTEELDKDGAELFEGEIIEIQKLSETVVRVILHSDDAPDYIPGSYFTLEVPGSGVSRAYSPWSQPIDIPSMEFLIRLLPGGAMSEYLSNTAAKGDALKMMGPYGDFRWNGTKNPLVFVAGGTGLAPVLSMLDKIIAERRHREKITLYFGVNRMEDLFFMEELQYRQEIMPRLDVHIAVAEENDSWKGLVGHVTELISQADIRPNTEAFLCGPPPMVAAATQKLLSYGVEPSSIRSERFSIVAGAKQ